MPAVPMQIFRREEIPLRVQEREARGKLRGLGINCYIELAPPRTLPRTSSGKLSRARAKADFLDRSAWDADGFPMAAPEVRAQAG